MVIAGVESNVKPKPFVKWAGGKTQLLPELRTRTPKKYGRYFEPFLGGGAFFFDLLPEAAFINDINEKLIAAYSDISKNTNSLLEQLSNLQNRYDKLSESDRSEFYYKIRNQYNSNAKESTKRTAQLIFLNKTCFNGLYRENSKGKFNVPFGRYKKPKIMDVGNIKAIASALQGATITSLPFQEALKRAVASDFVYLDPPYDPISSTSSFTSYSKDNFARANQIELAEVVKDLDRRGCFVLLSNSATAFIRGLYQGYRMETVLANRAINATSTGRGQIDELLVMNYK